MLFLDSKKAWVGVFLNGWSQKRYISHGYMDGSVWTGYSLLGIDASLEVIIANVVDLDSLEDERAI